MMSIFKYYKEIPLWKKVTAGLILGIITGLILKEKAADLSLIGEFFMRLIKMIIVPLIYISIVNAIISVEDTSQLTRMTVKAMILFVFTTCFAVAIGLILANVMKPGVGLELQSLGLQKLDGSVPLDATMSFSSFMKDIIPENALNALVSGKLLQVVFFSFFTGFVINLLSKEREGVVRVLNVGSKIVFKMMEIVLRLAPYGAFGFSAAVVGLQGVSALQNLGFLMLIFLAAVFLQYIVFGIMILCSGISPIPFYKKSLGYQILALSTSSSKATLPSTMQVCAEKLGVSQVSTSFILPLGAAINMNGTSIYLGVCTLFFAQIYHVDLSVMQYAIIIFTSTIGSMGAAGIPSGSIVMLPMVLASVNIPIDGIALLVGIDRILDMFRTALNITGDAVITLIVDKSEKTLDEAKYSSF